jgi:hypothetical protein
VVTPVAEDADPPRPPTVLLLVGGLALAGGAFLVGRRQMGVAPLRARHARGGAQHVRPEARHARVRGHLRRVVAAADRVASPPAALPDGFLAGEPAGQRPLRSHRRVHSAPGEVIDLTDTAMARRAVAHLLAALAGVSAASTADARRPVRSVLDALADALGERPAVPAGRFAGLAAAVAGAADLASVPSTPATDALVASLQRWPTTRWPPGCSAPACRRCS